MVIAIVIGGVVVAYLVWSFAKMLRLNLDPRQHELASRLVILASDERSIGELFGFLSSHWSDREASHRIAHALSLLKGKVPHEVEQLAIDRGHRAAMILRRVDSLCRD